MTTVYMQDIIKAAQQNAAVPSKGAMLRVEFANAARSSVAADKFGLQAAIEDALSLLGIVYDYAGGGKLDTSQPGCGVYVDLSLNTEPDDFDTWFDENHQILGASLMANGATGMRTEAKYVHFKLNVSDIKPPLPF